MLPIPAQTVGLCRVGTMRASIQRIDAAAIVGPEAIDL
jgi:hypothetical protein